MSFFIILLELSLLIMSTKELLPKSLIIAKPSFSSQQNISGTLICFFRIPAISKKIFERLSFCARVHKNISCLIQCSL